MTDSYAEELLINKFKEIEGLVINEDGSIPEVSFPNESFDRPDDGYWYELFFIPAVPFQSELGATGRTRWTGILQINICVPKDSGITPLNSRYENVAKLFRGGLIIEGIRILRTYRTSALDDGDYYVMPVSVEWQADLER